MLSASSGHLDAVSYLLDSGANIGAQNLDRNTALHMACLNCHDAMVALLLSKNAPLESVNIGKSTPLLVAVAEGDMDSTLVLLDAGADINASDHRGHTPLMRAAMNDFIGLVDLLMSKGGAALDIDAVGSGEYPFESILSYI